MSETITEKKSFLTTAMENVRAKKAENDSDTETPVTDEVAAKRLLKKAGIAFVGTVAALATVYVIAKKVGQESSSEVESADTETTDEN